MVTAVRGRIGDMQERCGRIEGRARETRKPVCQVTVRAALKALTEPDRTVSLFPAPPPPAAVGEGSIS